MKAFGLSQIQAEAIVEMKLRRLQGLEKEKIEQLYRLTWNFPRENEYTGKYSEKMQTAKAETKAQYEEYTEQKEKEKREEIKKDVPYKGMERKNLWRLVEMVGLAML